uniref:Uncharacterized protein n=1 Tax=Caenorhabditis japonica TaxID=281687 RepID=A0A8R1E5J3_CAEJA
MEEEDGELLERRAKFPGNFTKLLMEREIHGGKRKYKFPGQTYQHHYQLFASAKPQIACELELNKIDNVRENGSQFGHLAECLGFSPDGRYLAFLSHGRTAISILRYSGVKNGPPADDEAGVERMFEHAEIFNMNNLPGYNSAQRESVEASWWTDDSSTLIVQLKFRKWLEDDDDQEENEENLCPTVLNLLVWIFKVTAVNSGSIY